MTDHTEAYQALSKLRKQQQREGVLPHWFKSAGYDLFVKSYLHEATNWNEQIARICDTAAKFAPRHLPENPFGKTWSAVFQYLVNHNYMVLPTPTLANTGTSRGLSVSCSGQYIGDSIDSFYSNLHESAVLSKLGFGTSGYFGDVRYRGSPISSGGVASGVYPVLEDYWTMANKVSQSGVRRGSFAGYIPISHADFTEVVHNVKANPDGKHLGINIGEQEAYDIENHKSELLVKNFQKLLELRMTGRGYIAMQDNINNTQPEMYKVHGLSNKSQGLCVSGDTKILTKEGYKTIESLAGNTVECWNGDEWSYTDLFKTSDNQPVMTVTLNNGFTIEATPEHKWFVITQTGKQVYSGTVIKKTSELIEGDKLIKFNLEPVTHGTLELEHAYANGFHTADGTVYQATNKPRISLYGVKHTVLPRLTGYSSVTTDSSNRINVNYKKDVLQDKFFIPDTAYSVQTRLLWLAGLLDGDGTVTNNGTAQGLQLVSTHYEFLKELLLMLQELGVHSTISKTRDEGYRKLPANDGSGTLKEYWCNTTYRILIGSLGITKLLDLGMVCTRLQLRYVSNPKSSLEYTKVVSVVDEGREIATYCGNEPKQNKLMLNGVITHNCSEITLHQDDEHTYSCILLSMNAVTYDQWKNTKAVFFAQVFLDCMVSEFIHSAENINGMEKIIRHTKKGRAVGLGITGLHTYMQSQNMVFGEWDSMMFNRDIYRYLNDESINASKWLAEQLGEPEWCAGTGLRNTHRTAQMPNKSSSLIFGQVSEGINPITGNVFNQRVSTGEVFRINPEFIKLLRKYNKFTDDVLASVSAFNGSCQHLDFLSEHDKAVFRTAFEIPQHDIISMAEQRQPFIDQSQSLNLFLPQNATAKYVAELHIRAIQSKLLKNLYYINTVNADYKILESCSACAS